MGFFDTLGKKATEAYNVTTKKTGELAKEAKLRNRYQQPFIYGAIKYK